jgi:hypothetical protein
MLGDLFARRIFLSGFTVAIDAGRRSNVTAQKSLLQEDKYDHSCPAHCIQLLRFTRTNSEESTRFVLRPVVSFVASKLSAGITHPVVMTVEPSTR